VPQATYGGFWIRVAAYLIDWVIGGVIGFALGFVIGIMAVITHPENPTVAATDLRPVTTAIGLLINLAYFTVQWTISGATIGQRLFRLRVVDADLLGGVEHQVHGLAQLRLQVGVGVHAVHLGQVLGSICHIAPAVRVSERFPEAIFELAVAHAVAPARASVDVWRLAHILGAARQHGVGLA